MAKQNNNSKRKGRYKQVQTKVPQGEKGSVHHGTAILHLPWGKVSNLPKGYRPARRENKLKYSCLKENAYLERRG